MHIQSVLYISKMSGIAAAVTTLATLSAMKFINTGDKMIDNTLNVIMGILVASLMTFLQRPEVYNWIVYNCWDRPKDPTQFTASYYKFEEDNNIITIYPRLNIYETNEIINSWFNKCYKVTESSSLNNPIYLYLIQNGYPVYVLLFGGGVSKDIHIYCQNKSALSTVYTDIQTKIQEMMKKKTNVKDTRQKLYLTNTTTKEMFEFKSYISERKTFDKIYYDQKEELVGVLEKFKAGTLYPPSISMDNKLGILLYGPPGTGKTGTISAIANYLKKDIIVINFSEVTTCAQLDFIVHSKNYVNHIFVFDEFDCVLDVLVGKKAGEADSTEPPQEKMNWAELLAVAEKEERAKILEMMKEGRTKEKKPERITLGYLLQKLDGIEDATGRLIIATTNHPEHINPALLRPGRFDLKLCLGNCSAQMYEDILTNFFASGGDNTENLRKRIVEAELPVHRWSPLQVINTALVEKTLDKTLKKLQG